ncbi:V-type proton ATPase subunit G [Acrasis kona]|uniref:V-type proton ATPase subunit G n=1 Tax=Acrasis kona TaxID=1008807 RepID=A0AAW2Z2S0_9EUKA
MSQSSTPTTRLLVEAQQQASQIIAEARKLKQVRLKQCKEEAEREVARYKDSREKQFQQKRNDTTTGSSDSSVTLQYQKQKAINDINISAESAKPQVLKKIIDLVTNVDTSISEGQMTHIQRKLEDGQPAQPAEEQTKAPRKSKEDSSRRRKLDDDDEPEDDFMNI